MDQRYQKDRILNIVSKVFIYFCLVVFAIIVLFPFYWMIMTSFKSYGSYSGDGVTSIIPKVFTFENYVNAFANSSVPFGRYLLNTVVFSVSTTVLMLICTVLASFAFARFNFKGKNIIFTIFLSLMMIPNELVIITNYVTITNLDLRNTFMGLILPSVTSVFYIYLLKENFNQVPDELYLAAKVDGTKDLKYLFKVLVPICKPTIISIVILKIIECWNSYVWPRLITDKNIYFLVSNGIQEIRETGFGRENIPMMMAAVVIISVPLIILFIIFRKQIMAGVSRGGMKG